MGRIRSRRSCRLRQGFCGMCAPRAGQSGLLASYLQPGVGGREEVYGTADEDEIYRMLEEGVPALLAEGEVYLTDAFRSLQAAPPRITVGVRCTAVCWIWKWIPASSRWQS